MNASDVTISIELEFGVFGILGLKNDSFLWLSFSHSVKACRITSRIPSDEPTYTHVEIEPR